jgi:tetratricopeptide (TPR) repeat protein
MRIRLFFLTILLMISSSVTLAQTTAAEFYQRGIARYERKEFAMAIEDFTKAIKLQPDLTVSYIFRGLAFSGLGEPERAIADYTKAMELAPTSAVPYLGRASIRVGKGDPDGAIADYTKAIELDPNNAAYYTLRSETYSLLGKVALAAADNKIAEELERKANTANREALLKNQGDLQYGLWINDDDMLSLRFFAGGVVSLNDIDEEGSIKGNYLRTGASVEMTFENGRRASATLKGNKLSVRFTYKDGSTRDTVLTQE